MSIPLSGDDDQIDWAEVDEDPGRLARLVPDDVDRFWALLILLKDPDCRIVQKATYERCVQVFYEASSGNSDFAA